MGRPSYGVDAPGLVRAFFGVGSLSLVTGAVLLGAVHALWARWAGGALSFVAAYALGMGAYMLWGSLVGKVRGREQILDLVSWTGAERVLDLGCGRGLLLVGAARRLSTGTAVGVDLWLARDQSGNSADAARENAVAEGVAERVSLETADMRTLPFEAESFDVVVSGWAVHNLEERADREKALAEVVRVLRPGGWVVLDDIANRAEYAATLEHLGLRDVRIVVDAPWRDAFRAAVSFGSFRPATVVGRK